jgi:FdhD protein
MSNPAISHIRITRVQNDVASATEDALAAEEPLEIRLLHGPARQREINNITVTMRTPGQDADLAAGFLFTEGIISGFNDIAHISTGSEISNIIQVSLHEHVKPMLKTTQRNFFANAGCGVCGKTELDAIYAPLQHTNATAHTLQIPYTLLTSLPAQLRQQQSTFENTGGLHAAGLFNSNGQLLVLKEDIGRHNAVDKVIGSALRQSIFPLDQHILLLSGRAGFELIQKAAVAGIRIIAAVSAPSTMAVKMAQENDMTLVGFLREQRFNIYTGEKRIAL